MELMFALDLQLKLKALTLYLQQTEALFLKILRRLCRAHDKNFIGTNINVKIYQKITTVSG